MTGREIVKRVVDFRNPPRIGYNFSDGLTDFASIGGCRLVNTESPATDWGKDPGLLSLVPGFIGEVSRDVFGNVWGRLETITKGEVRRGILESGWSDADSYQFPQVDTSGRAAAANSRLGLGDKYAMGWLPGLPFSILRYMRGMENFLMDVALEPERIVAMSERVVDFLLQMVDYYGEVGADAVAICEDWGTQSALLVSPEQWRKLFRPAFEAVVGRAHHYGMHFYMHSCGHIYEIIGDLIDVGVNVLQLDQPELMGLERLSQNFGGRVAFDCPVDIQTVMPTGDKALIQSRARAMLKLLGGSRGGFIGKDYPQWDAVGVDPQWAAWAREALVGSV